MCCSHCNQARETVGRLQVNDRVCLRRRRSQARRRQPAEKLTDSLLSQLQRRREDTMRFARLAGREASRVQRRDRSRDCVARWICEPRTWHPCQADLRTAARMDPEKQSSLRSRALSRTYLISPARDAAGASRCAPRACPRCPEAGFAFPARRPEARAPRRSTAGACSRQTG